MDEKAQSPDHLPALKKADLEAHMQMSREDFLLALQEEDMAAAQPSPAASFLRERGPLLGVGAVALVAAVLLSRRMPRRQLHTWLGRSAKFGPLIASFIRHRR